MKKDTQPTEEIKDIAIIGEGHLSLEKPKDDMEYASKSASQLKEVVRTNKWITNIQGKEHLSFEAWQTIGKFYGYTVDTDSRDAEYIEFGGIWGFKGHASVINERTGQRVGGASALCMSDERNWKGRDKFALMSMAQTRAGSKALRQILSWVVALAGYSATPAEEMDGVSASLNINKDHSSIKDNALHNPGNNAPQIANDDLGLKEPTTLICMDCDKGISQKVFDFSTKRFGRALCMTCQKKA